MTGRRRSFWGWGYDDAAATDTELAPYLAALAAQFDQEFSKTPSPNETDLDLPRSRLRAPSALQHLMSADPIDRAGHHYGKSYRDIVRGLHNDFPSPPDLVARPTSEREIVSVLEWCEERGAAVVPFGGGSSVVGGVETSIGGLHRGVVTLDLGRMDGLVDLDHASRSARFQAGILGPALEDRLRPHGLTLRHFPQSFEFSSLGGWIATRSAGHYATGGTHIDDYVQSLRAVTPRGVIETRRVPASGAGPSPDRLLIGSEGVLGIIVSAWMRLQARPEHRAGGSFLFPGGFTSGGRALRALGQSGLLPTNCRLLDPVEALMSGTGRGDGAVLILGFESADHEVGPWMDRAVEICRDLGGQVMQQSNGGAAKRWRQAFLRAPYLRDGLVARGVLIETFESAVTWDRFADFHEAVMAAAMRVLVAECGAGLVTARVTHVYPDGAAPYYTVIAPAERGREVEQWDAVKTAVSETLLSAGGTITHHHAVGRDHRRWYDLQRPEPFAAALRAVKGTLDPAGMLNPGVLLDAGSP